MKTLIQFTVIFSKTKQTYPVYVKSCKWGEGSGFTVKSVSFTRDISEAAGFSLVAAHAIAEQYWNRVVKLTDEAGVVKEQATTALQQAQYKKMRVAKKLRNDANRDFAELFQDFIKLQQSAGVL